MYSVYICGVSGRLGRMKKLKSIFPRSFFGRAVLIVVVPILVIQIVLSVVFVQRHYERVTQQMTGSVLDVVNALVAQIDSQPPDMRALDRSGLAAALELELQWLDGPLPRPQTRAPWYDLAGKEALSVLRSQAPSLLAAALRTDPDRAVLWLETGHGTLQVAIPRNRLAPTNPHQLLVIVFAASLVMILVALQYLRLQIRPIRRLGAAAEAYGRGQALPLRASGAKEIRAAGLAFIDMRNRIERQNAQRKLMLSGLGHDMRTPLTRMRLQLSMSDPSEDRDALEAEIADLERLLNTFLDYARGDSQVREGVFDPVALLTDLAGRYRAAGKPVEMHIADGVPREVRLREGQLERALDNILGNALEYGSRARVAMSAKPDTLTLTVEDDGPGIEPADRARACEPFVRLDTSRNQDVGAHVGLGLAIAQDVMRAHGGRLVLDDSETLGGLLVRLTLPLQDRR